jgi:DUF438 domain-containing protein
MDDAKICKYVLDALPYPVVFVDVGHVIRYMNKRAEFHYYGERGYRDLIGKSIFECHREEKSIEMIKAAVEKLRNHGQEIFLKVNVRNERVYIVPVRNEGGELLGYYERFELNLQK